MGGVSQQVQVQQGVRGLERYVKRRMQVQELQKQEQMVQ
jgi:hypothetical protein